MKHVPSTLSKKKLALSRKPLLEHCILERQNSRSRSHSKWCMFLYSQKKSDVFFFLRKQVMYFVVVEFQMGPIVMVG